MLTTAEEPLHFHSAPAVPSKEAEKTFEALHGFKMQLIAAEPLVCDPVAITYDEDGRAFVCEMSDYPYTDKAHHKASQENPTDQAIGKVRLLVDSDGDGVFDKATVFADGLSWPTGAACWKGGIIVVATPDIWYLKDTDGDGVADVRQKLFTGLKKLNIQAVANNPIWGLDNKIYIAGGSNAGTLQNLVHPEEKPLTFRRNDLILDPVKMTIELASGGARFGNTRDDWGNRFLCNIRNPLEHVVIEQRYLARNPYLPPVNPLNDVAESGDQLPVYRISPPEQWREFRAKRWTGDSTVASHMPRSELVGSGVVTSSSGCTIYRGDAYPKEFYGNAFVADVAGNLFYRLALTPDGVTFKGTRVDGKKEMVASRDIWFRPVNFANAPDGTLTVCDMYREVIEHPWSLPDDIHAALDLERGRDMGRLYRLAPPESSLTLQSRERSAFNKSHAPGSGEPGYKAPQLSKASTTELVALLTHPNAWHRDTAHRLLFERQDKAAVSLLREMVEKNENPLTKMEAMQVLDGMSSLPATSLLTALKSSDSNLKRAGIRMAEDVVGQDKTLEKADSRSLVAELTTIASNDGTPAKFQQALTLAGILFPDGFDSLIAQQLSDSWFQIAALTAPVEDVDQLVFEILPKCKRGEDLNTFMGLAGECIGGIRHTPKDFSPIHEQEHDAWFVTRLYKASKSQPEAAEAGLSGFLRGLAKKGSLIPTAWLKEDAKNWLVSVAAGKTKTALTAKSAVDDRTRAIALLALLEFPKLQPIAAKLLQPTEPDAVRVATIKLLGQQRDAKVADLLLETWPTLTPAPREAALQAMIGRPQLVEALLSALEQGHIKPAEISATTRTLLSKNANVKVREHAASLFGGGGSRAEAITKYRSALTLKADAAAGHKVYQTVCAACHRKGDEGRDIGPNLATIMSWTSEQMLTNILDPNREVSPNFLLYIVETNDGRTLSGLITSETPTSVALKGADGVEQSVARSEVKSLKSAGISLMPEGLEASITPQQMADLMAFLKS